MDSRRRSAPPDEVVPEEVDDFSIVGTAIRPGLLLDLANELDLCA